MIRNSGIIQSAITKIVYELNGEYFEEKYGVVQVYWLSGRACVIITFISWLNERMKLIICKVVSYISGGSEWFLCRNLMHPQVFLLQSCKHKWSISTTYRHEIENKLRLIWNGFYLSSYYYSCLRLSWVRKHPETFNLLFTIGDVWKLLSKISNSIIGMVLRHLQVADIRGNTMSNDNNIFTHINRIYREIEVYSMYNISIMITHGLNIIFRCNYFFRKF